MTTKHRGMWVTLAAIAIFVVAAVGFKGGIAESGNVSAGEIRPALRLIEKDTTQSPEVNPTTFEQRQFISIPDMGNASPYPSVMTVNAPGRKVTKATVRLRFLVNGRTDDLDIYLLAPNGVGTVLMSDAGGTGFTDQLVFEFDQAAANVIGDDGPLPTATGATVSSRPVNYESFNADVFDNPGPGAGTNFPANLDIFNGVNPNGEWRLLVVDDTAGNNGNFSGGWDLILSLDEMIVNTTQDGVFFDGCTVQNCTLREAIIEAPPGGTIVFSPLFDTPQTINLVLNPRQFPNPPIASLLFNKSFTINGPGAHLLTIAGINRTNPNVESRVFELINNLNQVTLNGMTITGGIATGGPGIGVARGGAIFSEGSLRLNNCVVTGNTADSGGAISSGFRLRMNGTSVTNNVAIGSGAETAGAIFSESAFEIDRSTISGNRVLNSAPNSAGAIYSENIAFFGSEITNSTITDNVSMGSGDAGSIFVEERGPTLGLRNNIIAGNNYNTSTADVVGSFIRSAGYNLIGNPGSVVFDGPFDQSGTAAAPLDPHLTPLNFYGGNTSTHALLGSSTALDQGTSDPIPEPPFPFPTPTPSGTPTPTPAQFDQRGAVRPADIPAIPNASAGSDIGSFEAATTLIVNKVADTDDGACTFLDCSFREAIAAAPSGGIVYFSPLFNTSRTITLSSGTLTINKNLTILGTGANLTTISGNLQSRVFTIGSPSFTVNLHGLTIANGFPESSAGGAITNNGKLTITDSHITGSFATQGGGIFNGSSGTLTLIRSTVSNNTTLNGDTGGGIDSRGTLTVLNSTISGNNASFGSNNAGGIRFAGASPTTTAYIEDSTITNNTTAGAGSASGLRRTSGLIDLLTGTIVAGNVNNSTFADVVESGGANIVSRSNLIGNPGTIQFPASSRVGTPANPLNPLLSPLANYGGPTPTHAIASPASQAINGPFPWIGRLNSDQRGFVRSFNSGSFPSSPDIGAFEAQGTPVPAISISDVSQVEGNNGTSAFIFNVTLSAPSAQTVMVSFATANGTAIAGSDYTFASATALVFGPNETTKQITVLVNGDTSVEPDETFFVNLSMLANGVIADGQGMGTIRDDDAPGNFIVTNANDAGTGSLRQAVTAATAGSTVLFDQNFFSTPRFITLTSGEIPINKNLTIQGRGANLLSVSGSNQSRVFNITGSVTVNVGGMTITSGNASGSRGGAVTATGATLSITDCTITSSNAALGGGGIFTSGGTLNITRSTFNGNNTTGGGGGALSLSGTRGNIANSTISTNNSDGVGGGILYAGPGLLEITNTTIANNFAPAASGGAVYAVGNTAVVAFRNTLIAGNTAPNLLIDTSTPSAAIVSLGFNLTSDNGGGFLTEPGDRINANAALGVLSNNGGPTRTHALMAGSAALDAGSNVGSGANTDQRGTGFPRTIDLNGFTNAGDATDIGAFEQQTAPVQATQFGIVAPSAVTSGSQFSFTVFALDPTSNQVGDYRGTIRFTSNSAGTLPFDYTFTAADNGEHTFQATLTTIGSRTITATDISNQSITGTSGTISVTAVVPTATPTPTPMATPTPLPAGGLEGDLASRPNGDGVHRANDLAAIQLFFAGEPFAAGSNEFQRTDVAPFETRGNGQIHAADVQLVRNYIATLAVSQPAGGPTAPVVIRPHDPIAKADSAESPRRMQIMASRHAEQVTAVISMDGTGDETVMTFTINFDPAVLTNPVVKPGRGFTEGTDLITNMTNLSGGEIGVLLDSNSAVTVSGGEVLFVTFDVTRAGPAGGTTLAFSSSLTAASVSDRHANEVAVKYDGCDVQISPPGIRQAELIIFARLDLAVTQHCFFGLLDALDIDGGRPEAIFEFKKRSL